MPRLRWTQTHDVIELSVIDHCVYEYFVEQLNSRNINQYTVSDLRYSSLSEELQQRFGRIKNFVQTRLQLTDFDFVLDTSDQDSLNHLHQQWVKLHQRHPNIELIADKLCPGDMAAINRLIHTIEGSTTAIEAKTPEPGYKMFNHFGPKILKFGVYNISIEYDNLGRSTWQKWLNNDTTIDTDLNDFNDMYTSLKIRVSRTETSPVPENYQKWCNKHKLSCTGNQLPLANFDRLDENLLQYRQMFYKNSLVENNFITLE